MPHEPASASYRSNGAQLNLPNGGYGAPSGRQSSYGASGAQSSYGQQQSAPQQNGYGAPSRQTSSYGTKSGRSRQSAPSYGSARQAAPTYPPSPARQAAAPQYGAPARKSSVQYGAPIQQQLQAPSYDQQSAPLEDEGDSY